MTTDPITPPPELVREWYGSEDCPDGANASANYLCTQAAQWGADQELEACCEWLDRRLFGRDEIAELRAARRPEPQTLNSVALQMLGTIERDAHYIPEITDTIRRALEALDD